MINFSLLKKNVPNEIELVEKDKPNTSRRAIFCMFLVTDKERNKKTHFLI